MPNTPDQNEETPAWLQLSDFSLNFIHKNSLKLNIHLKYVMVTLTYNVQTLNSFAINIVVTLIINYWT